jgi:hypothetical protein
LLNHLDVNRPDLNLPQMSFEFSLLVRDTAAEFVEDILIVVDYQNSEITLLHGIPKLIDERIKKDKWKLATKLASASGQALKRTPPNSEHLLNDGPTLAL